MRDLREPRDVAITWFQKAEKETDVFDKFVALWFTLNALYNEFSFGNERNAIGDFIYSEKCSLSRRSLIRILEGDHVTFFKQRVIRDARGVATDTAEDAAVLRNSMYSYKKQLKALLMILYQVRCNLFHGSKEYLGDSDMQIVGMGADALSFILREVLRPVHERASSEILRAAQSSRAPR